MTESFSDLSIKAQMWINQPPHKVYQAFIDPSYTTKFWFSESTGKLEEGKTVTWTWKMYGFSSEVNVEKLIENQSIILSFSDKTKATWHFEPYQNGTITTIKCEDFKGEASSIVHHAVDQMGGYAIVLCGAKAYLEHGLEMHFVSDMAKENWVEGYQQ